MSHRENAVPLARLSAGHAGRLVEVQGGRKLTRRLLALGLRMGSEIQVLHHRGTGMVISHGGTRIALGAGIVEKLRVVPLDKQAAAS